MQLSESNLKRLEKHMLEHDTALISAMCFKADCGMGDPISKRKNRERIKTLEEKASSKGSRYGFTRVSGGFLENDADATTKESSLFLVDLTDSGNLKKDIMKWGFEFEQNFVIFIPAGEFTAVSISTSECDGVDLPFNVEKNIGKIQIEKIGIEFTEADCTPFIFEKKETPKLTGWAGAGAMQAMEKDAPYYVPDGFFDDS